MRKAQGLSINTIIIAAIALIVLVLLVLIFTGNLRNFRENAATCEANGGECVPGDLNNDGKVIQCSGQFDKISPQYLCSGSIGSVNDVCCVRA